mmetsp:Transcript_26555/g.85147  ORF Transcript_26555/g.85147 Transcript_26555/m.85147 type:complete len:286 (+) Transcript_26555:472-1329(+)
MASSASAGTRSTGARSSTIIGPLARSSGSGAPRRASSARQAATRRRPSWRCTGRAPPSLSPSTTASTSSLTAQTASTAGCARVTGFRSRMSQRSSRRQTCAPRRTCRTMPSSSATGWPTSTRCATREGLCPTSASSSQSGRASSPTPPPSRRRRSCVWPSRRRPLACSLRRRAARPRTASRVPRSSIPRSRASTNARPSASALRRRWTASTLLCSAWASRGRRRCEWRHGAQRQRCRLRVASCFPGGRCVSRCLRRSGRSVSHSLPVPSLLMQSTAYVIIVAPPG